MCEKIRYEKYLLFRSLRCVVSELNRLGCRTKEWTSARGRAHKARPWDTGSVYLTLVLALFPVGFALISPYPLSFGSSLLDLFYLPFYILIDILSSSLSFELPEILGLLAGLSAYLLYCMVAAWIMLRLDRWLYKKQSTVDPGIK